MRYALILCLAAVPAAAQDEPPVGGIGRLACSEIVGAENAPYLAQAGDWALGYMAGRLDKGDEVAEGAALSPSDSVDVAAGIAIRCRENPDQPILAAVRDFAAKVFGTEAEGGEIAADPAAPPPQLPDEPYQPPEPRENQPPPSRPEDLT